MNEINLERLKELSDKMNLRFIDTDKENAYISKSLDISKPDRREVKKFFQRQLEASAGLMIKD